MELAPTYEKNPREYPSRVQNSLRTHRNMADVEVAVTTESSGEHDCISFWDIKSGMHLKSYKGGICSVHGLTFVGHDYLIGAQHEKQILHVWNTRKVRGLTLDS